MGNIPNKIKESFTSEYLYGQTSKLLNKEQKQLGCRNNYIVLRCTIKHRNNLTNSNMINLKNPKKGQKITLQREYDFNKGTYTQTYTIVAVFNGQIMLDSGETFHYFDFKR